MKKRPAIMIYMDILTLLRDGPVGPTRLARACNLSYDRLGNYLAPLLAKGLVIEGTEEGHEFYGITPEGLQLLRDMEGVMRRLLP